MTSCFCSIPKTNFVARDHLLKYPKVNQKSGPYAKENFPAEYFLEQCELLLAITPVRARVHYVRNI